MGFTCFTYCACNFQRVVYVFFSVRGNISCTNILDVTGPTHTVQTGILSSVWKAIVLRSTLNTSNSLLQAKGVKFTYIALTCIALIQLSFITLTPIRVMAPMCYLHHSQRHANQRHPALETIAQRSALNTSGTPLEPKKIKFIRTVIAFSSCHHTYPGHGTNLLYK